MIFLKIEKEIINLQVVLILFPNPLLTLSHPEALPWWVKSSGVRQSKVTKGTVLAGLREKRLRSPNMLKFSLCNSKDVQYLVFCHINNMSIYPWLHTVSLLISPLAAYDQHPFKEIIRQYIDYIQKKKCQKLIYLSRFEIVCVFSTFWFF